MIAQAALPWAALDLARHPGGLAASLAGCAAIAIVAGYLTWLCTNGDRKDG